MKTQLPQWLVDLVRSVYMDGLNNPSGLEEGLNEYPVEYLVSLLFAVKRDAMIRGTTKTTNSTLLYSRMNFLEKAKKFVEEQEAKQSD